MASVLLVGTFVLIFAIIIAPYWLLIVKPEQKAKSSLQKRFLIAAAGARAAIRLGLLKEAERLSHISALNWLLTRSGFVVVPIKRSLDQAALQVTVSVILQSGALLGLVAFAVVLRVTHLFSLALIGVPIAGLMPFWIVRRLAQRRLDKFEEQFPEAIDLIARTLRAGHAFPTALQLAATDLPDPIGSEFRVVYERQSYGLPVPDALREFSDRVPLLDVRFFVTSVLTQRETGGSLTDILDNLSTVIRERFRVKRHVRAVSAHGRTTGVVLSSMPPVLAAVMFIISPDNVTILFQDPLGQKLLAVALVLQIVGTLVIRRLCNIAY